MTMPLTDEELEQWRDGAAKAAAVLARTDRAEWGATEAQPDEAHIEDFKKTLEITRAAAEAEGPQRLHGVYVRGTDTVLCHTGTSPASGDRAAAIEWLMNCDPLRVVATIDAARAERDEVQAVFDRQWAADMRGIKAWQAKTGKTLTWPDQANLVEWLCDERDRLIARALAAEASADGWLDRWNATEQERIVEQAKREAEVRRLREAAQRVVNQVGPLIEAAAQSSVIQGTTDEAMVVLAVEYLSDLRAALSTATKEE